MSSLVRVRLCTLLSAFLVLLVSPHFNGNLFAFYGRNAYIRRISTLRYVFLAHVRLCTLASKSLARLELLVSPHFNGRRKRLFQAFPKDRKDKIQRYVGGTLGKGVIMTEKINGLTTAQRAEVLTQALPYIQKYYDKIIVVKYGGNAMINDELKEAVMGDIVLLSLIGIKVVLVHGGGPEINEMLGKIGKKSEFIDGLRVTDQETMDIVQMVLAGKVNKNLVNLLQNKGGKAIGLCGIDGHMIAAKPVRKELGYAGEITGVDVSSILDVLEKGYIPVVSTVGYDDKGNTYNINADTAAARIAGELKAESLISMTDIVGLLRDKDDPTTLIPKVYVSDAPKLIRDGVISGGMIPKINCCIEAIRRGVKKVFIIDGRIPHAILIETLTDEGIGTMFVSGN